MSSREWPLNLIDDYYEDTWSNDLPSDINKVLDVILSLKLEHDEEEAILSVYRDGNIASSVVKARIDVALDKLKDIHNLTHCMLWLTYGFNGLWNIVDKDSTWEDLKYNYGLFMHTRYIEELNQHKILTINSFINKTKQELLDIEGLSYSTYVRTMQYLMIIGYSSPDTLSFDLPSRYYKDFL